MGRDRLALNHAGGGRSGREEITRVFAMVGARAVPGQWESLCKAEESCGGFVGTDRTWEGSAA